MNDRTPRDARRSRQFTQVFALSVLLIIGGLVILLFLKRLPLPARILAGLVDIFAGCALLVMLRQATQRK